MAVESKSTTDPFQNYVYRYPHPLDAFFLPKTIALIGAKDTLGSVGRTIMLNLMSESFKGCLYPINPKRKEVFGLKCYPDLQSLPEKIDLAVIATPAITVPGVIAECVESNVKAAIVISAGFKELGHAGLELERQLLNEAQKGNLRIIGPNCLGVMNPLHGLNATFAKGMALSGNIAFISQSGAMCTAVLDWSFRERIGFSAFVSIGSMADVDWGDLINYLGQDPVTESILVYMETIGDPRSFLSAAREIALEKPIIVIKPGRSQEAAQAAASHTGSLAGSDEVFEAAMERVGVLRVDTISQLFNMASVLGRQPKPQGSRLAIVTNAGGPSVLATDATILEGASLAQLDASSVQQLNQFLPAAWSHGNPVDILGDANPERYAKTIDVLTRDPNIDGILAVLSPQDMTDPVGTAECLRPYAHLKDKPILASWMGGDFVSKGIEILSRSGIPTFEYPDDAAWSFAKMWQYTENLQSLYETPLSHESIFLLEEKSPAKQAAKLIRHVHEQKRTLLTEAESKQLLGVYGLPVVETAVAHDVKSAIAIAERIGYPVVLKLHSQTITHKSDVGGVKLNLESGEDVKQAFHEIKEAVSKKCSSSDFEGVTVQPMVKSEGFELILGSSVDPQFGPILLFGSGGILVEIFKDRALGLPPLNLTLARKLMQKTKIYQALQGTRGKTAVNLEQLEEILVRFSLLIVENRWIKECDINPLIASSSGIVALDARIILHDPSVTEAKLPKLAIRPYPANYIVGAHLKNGDPITVRPIRPEDELAMVDFHKELSEKSVRQRYFEFVSLSERVAHERLVHICFNDFDREIAIVAEKNMPASPPRKILGAARLSRIAGTDQADLKMIIRDHYHRMGVGSILMKQLIHIAKEENVGQIIATFLSENTGMIHLCQKLGFKLTEEANGSLTIAKLHLQLKNRGCKCHKNCG